MKNLIALFCLLAVGCHTLNLDYPSDIEGICEQARDDAKWCIKSKGFDLENEKDIRVQKHPGEKWYPNSQCWAWYSPVWKMYVAGLYWGSYIEIGCNPTTGQQINYPNLKHEFGHYWLCANGVQNHDPRFSACFIKWNEPTGYAILTMMGTNAIPLDYIEPE